MRITYAWVMVVGLSLSSLASAQTDLQLRCWQLMPVGEARLADFRKEVASLERSEPAAAWLGVYKLYLAALEQDRTAMLALAVSVKAPEQFPTVAGEGRELARLTALGYTEAQAGLTIIGRRSFEPLHGLRELDGALGREGQFLKGQANRADDARKLDDCRARLRQGYLAASRHLVERLFALNLVDRKKDAEALAAKAASLPYLSSSDALAGVLDRMDYAQATDLLIKPLLASEVALIESAPKLADVKPPATVAMTVEAARKAVQGGAAAYEGDVRIKLAPLSIACDRAAVLRDGEAVTITGSGNVSVRGVGPFVKGITASSFTFNSATGAFTFTGDVRLSAIDRTLKLRSCTVTRGGVIGDARSLLDDFTEAKESTRKLELAKKMAGVYTDQEMPAEARYLLALGLLRPHLTWHEPFETPAPKEDLIKEVRELAKMVEDDPQDWRWREAHAGEEWMAADIPQPIRDKLDRYNAQNAATRPADQRPLARAFWRIADPAHTDVARALGLLDLVNTPDARRWAADIRRNNTVLTFDVAGGYAAGKDGPVVMDVRSAAKVAFKVYRVRKAESLLGVAEGIGDDFMYRDYGLAAGTAMQKMHQLSAIQDRQKRLMARHARDKVELAAGDLVGSWESDVAGLEMVSDAQYLHWRHRDEWGDFEDEEAWYYDDRCEEYRPRINKEYRPRPGQISSWQCDRIVKIPAKMLGEAGAYVLAAEADGQTAYAPILVEPLSMTLRRCRDGVFALVSDSTGQKPAGGARIHAGQMLGEAVADAQGAAFAKVFASGDRAILAEKDGRFAIGGFGALFEGVYRSVWEEDWYGLKRQARMVRKMRDADMAAQVYADRCVVAAYTDRPTYRPGQQAQFKLIVRKLGAPTTRPGPTTRTFREDDFSLASTLALLPEGSEVSYSLIDPKGRVAGQGTLKLNDYGTAAGMVALSSESALGAYSMRVRINGVDRLVPDVLAVKDYRRPNFQVQVAGVPEKLDAAKDLKIEIAASYYFGKAVTGASVEARLVRPQEYKALAHASATLGAEGKATIELNLPEKLAGPHFVICAVTDDSGRTVSWSLPIQIGAEGVAPDAASSLGAVGRFVPMGQAFEVKTSAGEVKAHQKRGEGEVNLSFKADGGRAVVKLPAVGWYTLSAGGESAEIFAYGGAESPDEIDFVRDAGVGDESRWVNLTDYDRQESGNESRWERPGEELYALFGRHHAKIGENLRVLVYTPCRQARLLFTIEGRTVNDYHVVETRDEQSHYHVVEIPITARCLPNFYLQGRAIAGEEAANLPRAARLAKIEEKLKEADEGEDPRWCRVDVIDPRASANDEKLKIEVRPVRGEYRPGADVEVALKVTDAQGRGREAEVSLAAVDESVYTFGEDGVGSLTRFFADPHPATLYLPKTWRSSVGNMAYSARRHQFLSRQMAMEQALQKMAAQQDAARALEPSPAALPEMLRPLVIDGERPVASLPLGRLRTDFHETAAWQPQLRTGVDGLLKTSFKLPDSLTAYRLTAVGLTRQTEIGTARAALRVSKPLAVQVFLPRFAVESDRLMAVALVHNNTPRDRVCEAIWGVANAQNDGCEGLTNARGEGDGPRESPRSSVRGTITVPANSSARTTLWLKLDLIKTVKIEFSAAEGGDSDAEQRTLDVQPLGRRQEVALTGTFDKSTTLKLPAGFVARDLRISMSRGEVAEAMEGLGYLVDYPYGCVEQTMSRFLPSVVVKDAAQRTGLALPPDVAGKIPGVLEKGLARLYNFQHPDGGWGWWEKDATNDHMSIYVVDGLARCRLTGTAVDEGVLARGCDFIQSRLSREPRLDAGEQSRAWLALALAGRADGDALLVALRAAEKASPAQARYTWALACRALGKHEAGRQLWRGLRGDMPKTAEELALRLSCQLAYGETLAECYATSHALLALRQGHSWSSTQSTALAIESLASMLRYAAGATAARAVRIDLNSLSVLDVKGDADLAKLVHSVHLSGDSLPAGEGGTVSLLADCEEPVGYTLSATGTQRLDKVEATGDAVRLHREFLTLDGKPLAGPVAVGQVIAVRLTLTLKEARDYVLLEDRRPAGFEFADERLSGLAAARAANTEFRDNRLTTFFTALAAGANEVTYYLRAETPGTSHVLPAVAYPMYDDKLRGESASGTLEAK